MYPLDFDITIVEKIIDKIIIVCIRHTRYDTIVYTPRETNKQLLAKYQRILTPFTVAIHKNNEPEDIHHYGYEPN